MSIDGDAVVARVYAFLAAALAGDQRPDPEALAAELARVLDVQALAVLHDDGDQFQPVLSFGFGADPVEAVGEDLLDEAFGDGLPVLCSDHAVHRSLLAAPANFGGHPWGVVVVGSSLPGAIDGPLAHRVSDLAMGVAVVLNPLVPPPEVGDSRARRLRAGLESVLRLAASIEDDAPFRTAAKAIADAAVREFEWRRVLLVQERPELGVLPIAAAGAARAADVVIPERLSFVSGQTLLATRASMFLPGSRSQLLVGLEPVPGAVAAALVIEDDRPDAYDELDEHLARTLASIVGPLLRGLAAQESGHQARRVSVDTDERQRRRFTSLAHELRTPVTVILGYADLLAMPGRDSEQRQAYASTLARHARSLGRMVDNALVAWQLDDGTLELSSGRVNLFDAVAQVVETLGATDLDLDDVDPLHAIGDSFWLPKVIHALLENSRRYVPDAKVKISTDTQGELVRLAVHDDGPGIGSDELVHIFDAFHRGEDGGTGPHRGVGLGLTVARALVREMGGDLEAASAEGYGTTFTISLPRG